jgi:hypothetical protein
VFSVLKRKFGESLKARKYQLQIKEIKIKVILYNLLRAILSFSILIVIEGFYKATPCAFFKRERKKIPVKVPDASGSFFDRYPG